MHTTNLERALHYITAVENGATGEALAMFFSPEVVQEEFPNRLMPQGAKRDLDALLTSAERGQIVLSSQRFDVRNVVAAGETVALEMTWIGTLAIPIGDIPVGGEMKAHIATFIEFRLGLIVKQRSYDCFDEF